MKFNKIYFTIFAVASILTSLTIFSFKYVEKESKNLLEIKYKNLSVQTKKYISTLIEDKKNATLAFAVSTSKINSITEAIINNDTSKLNLEDFSKELRDKTNFKNIWFQIISKDGKSLYRSWTNDKGDDLNFRYDVKSILKTKEIQTTISIGHYDMTFKSMIPLFKNNNFIGVFEVITHFNSISKILEENSLENIIIADKKYFNKITKSFSKKHLEEYHIINLNAKDSFINLLSKYGIDKMISSNSYIIHKNYFIDKFTIKNNSNITLGYIITIKGLDTIDISNINDLKKDYLSYLVFMIIITILFFTALFYYLHSNKINQEKKRAQSIIDSQQNIIVITDGKKLKSANQQFLKFFTKFKTIDDFKNHHDCICEYFVDMQSSDYIINTNYNGRNWAEYILDNPNKNFKCAMKRDENLEYFTLKVNLYNFEFEDKPYIIVTLTNISHDIKQKFELERLNNHLEDLVSERTSELNSLNESLEYKIKEEIEKNQEKDKILFHQNKMASIGDILNNIAHQWRQPLSAITTSASSLMLKKDLEDLKNDDIDFYCHHIMENSNYLTKTINDFTSFFENEKNNIEFYLIDIFKDIENILRSTLNKNNIEIIIDIDKSYKLTTQKNDFQRAILNILTNSIDALNLENLDRKMILIKMNNNILEIHDNANGIDEKIINNVFEPYFTTKHQSIGAGIGLYMVQNLLEKNMNFKISLTNEKFIYEGRDYFGLKFSIELRK